MKTRPLRIHPFTVACVLCFWSEVSRGDDTIQGNLTVKGTITAKEIKVGVSPQAVATRKDIDAVHKEILAEVLAEVSKKLHFDKDSPEVRRFSNEITESVVKTIGKSSQDKNDLAKTFAPAADVSSLKRTVTELESKNKSLDQQMKMLEREIEQLRRELARRK